MEFKKYRRSQIAELREVTDEDIITHQMVMLKKDTSKRPEWNVSISGVDFENGSPKIGDMIARNPKNHKDQWLVAAEYFNDNFESVDK